MSHSLHDGFASEEPRSAPEPETAEQRSERLSKRRGFRIAGLGAVVFLLWEAVTMIGNIDRSVTGIIVLLGVIGLALLFERSVEEDREEHSDDD